VLPMVPRPTSTWAGMFVGHREQLCFWLRRMLLADKLDKSKAGPSTSLGMTSLERVMTQTPARAELGRGTLESRIGSPVQWTSRKLLWR
jgi:hypothetical protein